MIEQIPVPTREHQAQLAGLLQFLSLLEIYEREGLSPMLQRELEISQVIYQRHQNTIHTMQQRWEIRK